MKKTLKLTVILMIYLGISSNCMFAQKNRTLNTVELQSILKNYTEKYKSHINISSSAEEVLFKGRTNKAILRSNKISENKFKRDYPNSGGINSSIADYLIELGFKTVKECAEGDSYITQIGFTWKKDDILLHYIVYSIFEHPSVGTFYYLTFFAKDICGNDFRGPKE